MQYISAYSVTRLGIHDMISLILYRTLMIYTDERSFYAGV